MVKPTLLVPMAGLGKRFKDQGFFLPKPLIMVEDKQIIDYSFLSIIPEEYNLVFVVRRDHVNEFSIDKILQEKYGKDITLVICEELTHGTVCSCLLAEPYIAPDAPLVIYTLDVYFQPVFSVKSLPPEDDGLILTFKSNSPLYSYAQTDESGYVTKTAEKSPISSNASVGIYCFSKGRDFVHYAKQMVQNKLTTNNEYYIAPLYNLLVQAGKKISVQSVEKMHVMGTPEEMAFFVKNVCPRFGKKPIAIAADHSGFNCKDILRTELRKNQIDFIDFGTYSNKDCDYTDYIKAAAEHIKLGLCDFGICSCRSGQGANIAANKIDGIRSALVFDEYTAEYAIRHNCANFFSIPEKYVDAEMMSKIVAILKNTTFDGGRHTSRIQKLELL
jgi:RpiB/LacA/LacB family sugar-phosphate isomerase